MRRRAVATATGVLLTLLTACASLDGASIARPPQGRPSATPTTPPTTPATPTPDAPGPAEAADREPELRDEDRARTTFRRELRELYRERFGDFSSDFALPLGDGRSMLVSRSGSYDLVKLRATYSMTILAPDQTRMVIDLRATATDAWMSFVALPGRDQPDRPCWIHLDYELVSDAAGLDLPAGASIGVPPEVLGLLTGRVAGYDGGGMLVGTTDLATAAGMFGASVQRMFGVPYESRARVPATFMIFGDRLLGWRVDIADVVTASDEAGYLTRKLRRRAEAAWPPGTDASMTVEYSDFGERWAYRPPPAARTIEMTDEDSFETAMMRCTGVGASAA